MDQLDDHILTHILSFVDASPYTCAMARLRAVCSRWARVIPALDVNSPIAANASEYYKVALAICAHENPKDVRAFFKYIARPKADMDVIRDFVWRASMYGYDMASALVHEFTKCADVNECIQADYMISVPCMFGFFRMNRGDPKSKARYLDAIRRTGISVLRLISYLLLWMSVETDMEQIERARCATELYPMSDAYYIMHIIGPKATAARFECTEAELVREIACTSRSDNFGQFWIGPANIPIACHIDTILLHAQVDSGNAQAALWGHVIPCMSRGPYYKKAIADFLAVNGYLPLRVADMEAHADVSNLSRHNIRDTILEMMSASDRSIAAEKFRIQEGQSEHFFFARASANLFAQKRSPPYLDGYRIKELIKRGLIHRAPSRESILEIRHEANEE